MSPQILETFSRSCATGVLDSILQGSAIAFLAFSLLFMLRRRKAEIRFGVLFGALIATASLPLLRSMNGSSTSGMQSSLIRIEESWTPWIAAIWAVMATVGLVRVAAGIWRLRQLRRNCQPVNASVIPSAARQMLMAGRRRIEILVSREVSTPSAIGFLRPAVVLPAWVVAEMPASELTHVLAHEISHLRRYDDWTNLLQKVVKALFFFHPAVWWMENRLSLEREIACDDAVIRSTGNARGYAECLARIAERSFLRRSMAMAQAAVSRVRETSHRVARILKLETGQKTPLSIPAAAVLAVIAIGSFGILWKAPSVVSFDEPTQIAEAAAPAPLHLTPKPIDAAWHEPTAATVARTAKTPSGPAVKQPATRSVQGIRPRVIEASMTEDQPGAIVHSVMIVVVQQEDGIAMWRITTWQYSPSQQVRADRKKT